MPEGGLDVVYTWVDDAQPGYLDELRRHARSANDLNPNRTRDNLQLLRYSLRSLARFAPWVGRILIFSARPQVPAWLDLRSGRVEVLHHDAVIPPEELPTFNSFAIVSHLHRLPGLGRRFLYMEDDMLFGAPVRPEDFLDAAGRIRVFARLAYSVAPERRHDREGSPWNASIAQANDLLDRRFGRRRRRVVNHVPLLIDREIWGEMLAAWAEATRCTRASRFRAAGNIAPEFLYPHYLLATERGGEGGALRTYRDSFYFPLENSALLTRLLIAAVRALRPKFLALNDNFGDRPDPEAVRLVARFLEDCYPEPSPFERAP
ncbi:MAG: stealth conserved region 3 domain-containing protein [Pseudomonadota bacterium]